MINITTKTRAKESLKMFNKLNSFMFEQQCGELKNCTADQLSKLQNAMMVLADIIKKNS